MEQIIELIKERLSHIGEVPICNGRVETTFSIYGFTFILCYRCTFIILGLLVSSLLITKIKFINNISLKKQFQIAIFLILFSLIDGILQYFFQIMSNNFRRITSGFLAGIGFGLLVEIILNIFNQKHHNKRNYRNKNT